MRGHLFFSKAFPPFSQVQQSKTQTQLLGDDKEIAVGVQNMKSSFKRKPMTRNKKRLLVKVVDYLKSDTYMFAPLLNSRKFKFISAARGVGTTEPIKRTKRKLVEKIVDYLKSDSYMYASCLARQPISFSPEGPIQFVKRVSMEISTRMLTMEANQATVTDVLTDEQRFDSSLLETSISDLQTSAHKDITKKMIYANCRTSSVQGTLDLQLRKLLVD